MTRGEVRARILHGLNESATAPVFFTAAEIDGVIDEALEVLAEEVSAAKRTVLLPLQDGCMFYSLRALAPDCLAVTRLWDEARQRRLEPTTMDELDAQHQTWLTVTGEPRQWFPVSWDLFGLYPGVATGGSLLRADYLAWPRALQHDDDRPELLDADHEALVRYGVYDGAMKRWDVVTGLTAWNLFLSSLPAARGRHGLGQLRAKLWQAAPTDGGGYRVGL